MRKDIDINYFRGRLEEEKKELLGSLREIGVQTDDVDTQNWEGRQPNSNTKIPDPNEVADEQEEYQERVALTETFEDRLRAINAALKRVEDGTYGICIVSGEDIELDRLEANPSASTNKANMNNS